MTVLTSYTFTDKASEMANEAATKGFTADVMGWFEKELQAIHDAAVELGRELERKVTIKPAGAPTFPPDPAPAPKGKK